MNLPTQLSEHLFVVFWPPIEWEVDAKKFYVHDHIGKFLIYDRQTHFQ